MNVVFCILCGISIIVAIYVYVQYRKEVISKTDPDSEYNQRIQQLESDYNTKRQGMEDALKELQSKLNQNQTEEIEKLKSSYSDKRLELDTQFLAENADIQQQIEAIRNELKYYEGLQKAVVENFKEQDKIRSERDYYKISLSESDLSDVAKLKIVAREISKPVVLYKLIYEIYYKSKFDALFKKLIGSDDTGGIYKITNIKNERVYIGRTTNFLNRWRDHIKCGIGSDSGAQIRTRLYDAMKMDGCENFTFEILDRCDKDAQPDREKYWIEYYRSTEFGYNVQSGG